jgi:AMMECR1 domain-containing protein
MVVEGRSPEQANINKSTSRQSLQTMIKKESQLKDISFQKNGSVFTTLQEIPNHNLVEMAKVVISAKNSFFVENS